MKVIVVVDVASLAHAIGSGQRERSARASNRSRYVAPHLDTLVAVLEHRGFEVLELQVAVPVELVDTPGTPRASAARGPTPWAVDRARQWVDEQVVTLREIGIPLVVLRGGHDGTTEVGVDVAAACGTLVAASQIGINSNETEAILVITHDSDLHVLSTAAHPANVILAGCYNSDARRRLQQDRLPFVDLSADELTLLSDRWDPNLLAVRLSISGHTNAGDEPVVEQKLVDREVVEQPKDDCVVVADPHGLACSAATTLGMAALPTIESIRTALAHIGVGIDAPILATVPDVDFVGSLGGPSGDNRLRRAAWRQHDGELDQLARTFHDDGDDDTRVNRARLPLNRLPDERFSLQRNLSHRVTKQLATQMVCDVYRCLLGSTCRHIVVLTDSVDVTWALHLIPTFGLDESRVIRVGTTRMPIRRFSGARPQALDVRTEVLDAARLAELTRVTELFHGFERLPLADEQPTSGTSTSEDEDEGAVGVGGLAPDRPNPAHIPIRPRA